MKVELEQLYSSSVAPPVVQKLIFLPSLLFFIAAFVFVFCILSCVSVFHPLTLSLLNIQILDLHVS